MHTCGIDVAKVVGGQRRRVTHHGLAFTPKRPTYQLIILRCGPLRDAEDPAIHSQPIAVVDVELLRLVAVSQIPRLGSRKVPPLLASEAHESAAKLLSIGAQHNSDNTRNSIKTLVLRQLDRTKLKFRAQPPHELSSYGDKRYCRRMATIRVTRPDDLGVALRQARRAEGITQAELAQLVGVSRPWLSSFEVGRITSVRLDTVMRIIAALDVSVTLSRPAPPAPVDDEEPVDLDALIDGVDA